MKYFFASIVFIVTLLGITALVQAAPVYTSLRNILPEITNTYDLGISTAAWKHVYSGQFCLTGDSCISTWPTGGSGSSFGYPFPNNATSTALTFNATTTHSAIQLGASSGSNMFRMVPTLNYGTGASTGGAFYLNCTNSTEICSNFYSNAGTQTGAALIFSKQDNVLANKPNIRLDNDGTANTLVINQNNTTNTNPTVLINQKSNNTALDIESDNTGNLDTNMLLINYTGGGTGDNLLRINSNSISSQEQIRLDGITTGMEMVETDQDNSTGKGKFEIHGNNNQFSIDSRMVDDSGFEKLIGWTQTQQGASMMMAKPVALPGSAQWPDFNSRFGIVGINTATTTNYFSISTDASSGDGQGTPLDDIFVVKGSNGNVGIGTSTPTQKFTVQGAGSALQTLNCTVANGTCWTQFSDLGVVKGYLGYSANNGLASGIVDGSMVLRSAGNFYLSAGSAPALTMLSTGLMGLGTTTPASTLSVQGNGLFSGLLTTSALRLSSTTGSTQCLHADTSGNVTGTGSDCGSGSGSSFGYLFPNNATTTLLNFNGGLLSTASSTFSGTTHILSLDPINGVGPLMGPKNRPLFSTASTTVYIDQTGTCTNTPCYTTYQAAFDQIPIFLHNRYRIRLVGTYNNPTEDLIIWPSYADRIDPTLSLIERNPLVITGDQLNPANAVIGSLFVSGWFGDSVAVSGFTISHANPYDNENSGIGVYNTHEFALSSTTFAGPSGGTGYLCYGSVCASEANINVGSGVLAYYARSKHSGVFRQDDIYPNSITGSVTTRLFSNTGGEIMYFNSGHTSATSASSFLSTTNGMIYDSALHTLYGVSSLIPNSSEEFNIKPSFQFSSSTETTGIDYATTSNRSVRLYTTNNGFLTSYLSLVDNNTSNSAKIVLGTSNTAADATPRLSVWNDGNIAVGTSTDLSRFSIWGANTSANTSAFQVVNNASTTLFNIANDGTASSSKMTVSSLFTGPASLLNVVANGQVGIGVSNPIANITTSYLTVEGGDMVFGDEANTARSLFFRRNAATLGGLGTQSSILNIWKGTQSTLNDITIDTGPKVGIGTNGSANSVLQVSGNSTLTIPLLTISTSTINGTTTVFKVDTTGYTGVGTTSPFARLSVHANNGDTTRTLFAIGSSTASATTTLFSVDNTGAASTTSLYGAGLATCQSGNFLTWNAGAFGCAADQTGGGGGTFSWTPQIWGNSTSTTLGFLNGFLSTASSTIVGNATTTGTFYAGIASSTQLFGANLATCNSASSALTWAAGQFGCNSITGGSGTFSFTPSTNYGVTANATSTPIWFQSGLFASSTSQLADANFWGAVRIGLPSVSISSENKLSVIDDTNDYHGIFVQNKNAGASASTDIVAGNNNALVDPNAYIDMGANSTGNTNAAFSLFRPGDAYLFSNTGLGNLVIANASTTKSIIFGCGGLLIANECMRLSPTGIGIGTTSPRGFDVGSMTSKVNEEYVYATSTSMNIGIASTSNGLIRIGTSATTITFNNLNLLAGTIQDITLCNPGATAGAVTWANVHFSNGLAPSNTLTANQCDFATFQVTAGTSTPIIVLTGYLTGIQ